MNDLEEIALKYFKTEIIMMSKKWHDDLIRALKEAYELGKQN